MKIHTYTVIDIASGDVLDDDWYEYEGPISSCDPVTAVMGGSALLGAGASIYAAKKQAKAANNATELQERMFDITNENQRPYREAGYGALEQLQTGMNLNQNDPDSFMHRFGASDLNENLAPNWQFALQQGQGAIQNMASSGGGLLSGNALKGISDYTINKSGDLYQQALQNYTGNQTNIFNRLSSIAGLGQTANQATGNAAMTAAGNMGNSMMAAGQAQASGLVGGANALAGGLNNAASWYGINNMIKSPPMSSGGSSASTDSGMTVQW